MRAVGDKLRLDLAWGEPDQSMQEIAATRLVARSRNSANAILLTRSIATGM